MPVIFVADSTIGAIAMSKVMTPRFRSATMLLGVVVVSLGLGFLCAVHCHNLIFITASALVLSTGGCLVLFRNSLSHKLKAAGIVMGSAIAAIVLSAAIIYVGASPDAPPSSISDLIPASSMHLFVWVIFTLPPSIFTLFVLVLVAIWKRRETGWVKKSEVAFCCSIALIVLLISLYCFFVIWHPPEEFQISIGIGLALLLIGLLALRRAYGQSLEAKEQAERRSRSLLSAEERRQFEDLSSDLIHMRRIRHDLNNHAAVLKGLMAMGKTEEATRYLQNLRTSIEGCIKVRNQAPSVQTLLQMKQAVLAKHGISFSSRGIDDQDMEGWEKLEALTELGACILTGRADSSIETWAEDRDLYLRFTPCTGAEVMEAAKCLARSLPAFRIDSSPDVQTLILYSCETLRHSPVGSCTIDR